MNYDHEDDPPKKPWNTHSWNPNDESCGSCLFAFKLTGQHICRRFPPVSHSGPTGDGEWSYPKIRKDDWCGEWKEATSSN